jgi:hypothetical protein
MVRRYGPIVGSAAAGAPPEGAVSIVRATVDDEPALRAALYEAVCWRETPSRPPIEEVLSQPAVEVYLESWSRTGDLGFVAEDAAGHRGGTAWCRPFTTDRVLPPRPRSRAIISALQRPTPLHIDMQPFGCV